MRRIQPALLAASLLCLTLGVAAQVSPDLYSGLRWRNVGPFHGGRVASVTGVIGQPGTFYAGMPQGGIWKTTDAGVTWHPIADAITAVDSFGAIQVAPSDPNIIYAGSGDAVANATTGTDGDGIYKSTDAGQTWKRIGLEGTRRIPKIVIDPTNPDLVIVAAMAGTTGTQRGIFRTDNGGETWTNVLHPDDATGARDLSSPFDDPSVVFATTESDPLPAGGGRGATPGPSRTHLYKSLDEGKTWTEVTAFPLNNGRTAVAVAMHTHGQRIYVVGAGVRGGSGFYRSDDQGATFTHMAVDDGRISGRDYICGVWVDSQNPDRVYSLSTAAYASSDGGATFTAFKGAPGGEDMHDIWIDPTNGRRMLFGVDQGAAVTLNGGHSWSSYYALPVGQFYHISTDNRYPYWMLASQQDTGAVMIRDRGDVGDVSEVDWMPLPSSEFGTVTADPTDPNIVYGVGYGAAGGGSGLIKINLASGQWENVAPNFGADADKYRASRDSWRRADPFDPHSIYMDMQCLMVTHDRGHSWKAFSPDLTTEKGQPTVACGTPLPPEPAGANPGGGRGAPRGAFINDFAISTVKRGVFWTVSSNGQIYNSMDAGLHWNNVSNLTDAAGITFNTIEAGHTDINTAYLSGHAAGTEGNTPQIWRTHDAGKTWTRIVAGLPSGEPTGSWVNVIRADPKQAGLLYAGTETTVYVSFDDGDHWQSLRQNLPSTSIRDMVFHTDDHMSDLVIATYGRSFWILDDTTPLREVAAKAQAIAAAPAYFFKPGDAIRSRVSDNWDQPLNPELPHAANPPYGAILYYHLSQPPTGAITLQVYDAQGHLVRTMSSTPPTLPARWPYPSYWVATPASLALPTAVGTNRTHWDLRYDDPPALSLDLENQMNVAPGGHVTPGPHGPQAIPGVYTLKLTVDGHTLTQTLRVINDPRVGDGAKVTADLAAKNRLMLDAYQGAKLSFAANEAVRSLREQLASNPQAGLEPRIAAFGGIAADRTGGRGGRGAPAAPGAMQSFSALNAAFDAIVSTSQVGLDEAPSQAQLDTWRTDCAAYNRTLAAWKSQIAHLPAGLTSPPAPAALVCQATPPTPRASAH